jgi:Icc protein
MMAFSVSSSHGQPGLWGALALLGAASLALSCMRPSEERALQDERVGRAESDVLNVVVAEGHAVVRAVAPGRVSLWASAPRLNVSLSFTGPPPAELELEVYNCMPAAELSGPVAVLSSGRDVDGRCWFRLGPLGGEPLSVLVAPPDTERPSPFRFAVMSDVQEAIDAVSDIYEVINREVGLDFLLGAGDLTEYGTAVELERFQTELQALGIPYYTTLGNHEIWQSPSLYQEYFGRGSQSFEYRGARFSLIDSASATIDPMVYEWLDGWLALGAGQLHVVAMHVPPRDPVGLREVSFASRNEAAKLLARLARGGVDLTLYGHIHSYYRFENAGIPAFISGGGGSHPEQFDQMGRHFLVVDADPAVQAVSVRVVQVD